MTSSQTSGAIVSAVLRGVAPFFRNGVAALTSEPLRPIAIPAQRKTGSGSVRTRRDEWRTHSIPFDNYS